MNKALFLDRDGVVNVEVDYLYKVEDFVFVEGILELCRYYASLDYLIIIVTNQSGIARGYYSEEDFQTLSAWMIDEFNKHSIKIAKVYHCPHHPDINGECECRKPKPQMLLEAKKEFDIDMKKSLMVGDKERDILAALNAGVEETFLLCEGEEKIKSQATKVVKKLEEIWK
jgi:D-glycero-D-manno-heptose 1,7-bisphosphate phosphatase